MGSSSSKLRFLQGLLGSSDKSTDGINFAFRCPSCAPKQPNKRKLVIRLDNGNFHCWVCDLKGRTLDVLFKKYFPSQITRYKKEFNRFIDIEIIEKEVIDVKIPPGFKLLSLSVNNKDPDIKAVRRYVLNRGLSENDMWYFRLGTCAEGTHRRRVIMPSFNCDGKLNYYVARAIDDEQKRKYLNPSISKKQIIFNELNIKWDEELTIVEGPFDLTKSNFNTTCLLGSSLNESYELFKKIVKNKTPVLLGLDPDAMTKTHRLAKLLMEFGIPTRVLDHDGHEDVGAMSKKKFNLQRKNALVWSSDCRLYHLIGGMKSGSLI